MAAICLHNAAAMGCIGFVKWLFDEGADANAKDKFFNTPLFCALPKAHGGAADS